jgi:hypothetical protein
MVSNLESLKSRWYFVVALVCSKLHKQHVQIVALIMYMYLDQKAPALIYINFDFKLNIFDPVEVT